MTSNRSFIWLDKKASDSNSTPCPVTISNDSYDAYTTLHDETLNMIGTATLVYRTQVVENSSSLMTLVTLHINQLEFTLLNPSNVLGLMVDVYAYERYGGNHDQATTVLMTFDGADEECWFFVYHAAKHYMIMRKDGSPFPAGTITHGAMPAQLTYTHV